MKKSTKIIVLLLAFVLAISATAAVTVALLTDEDSAVNVMTVGNVYIEQYEQERNGAALQDFTQNKPWLPITSKNPGTESVILGSEAYELVGSSKIGVQDKIVTVENTGSTNAYVRTVIAYECPVGFNTSLMHINDNAAIKTTNSCYINLDGVRYLVAEYVYPEALKPNEVSAPSLLQTWLDYDAVNEDAVLFGGDMKILVLSQAVQANGFDTAAAGLNEAFGEVNAENAAVWFGASQPEKVEGNNKPAVLAAIEAAQPGDTVVLTEDTTIAGSAATEKLVIEKAITLDLNGKTLTTESGWGGIDLKGGASIINGTINHTGNTAAIKAFQVDTIENVTINVTQTDGKVKGGIVVQSGGSYVNTIRNVTINGATNGIECYNNAAEVAIGTISDVKINALQNGIYLNGGGVLGALTNVTIDAGDTGIRGDLKNLWSIDLNLLSCSVKGGKYGVDIWDEAPTNTGSTVTFNYDTATTFAGEEYKIKITLNEEVACTYQGDAQAAPVTIYVN